MKNLEDVRDFLRSQSTMALATVDEAGVPRCTPLFFVCDENLRLFWFSSPRSAHSKNCARNPVASLSVDAESRAWRAIRGVQMRGSIAAVRDRKVRSGIAAEFIAKFQLDGLARLALRRCTLYCFTPSWLRFIDNAVGFGSKFEVRLS